VQQAAACGIDVLAQIELQLALGRLRFEAQAALNSRQVALQWHRGRRFGHFAEDVAHDQPVLDERERHVGTLAHHGAHRVRHLGQARERPAAHRGESLGEPHGFDDMGGGDRVVLGAEQTRDLRHPALDRAIG
jgi:hypothetical protein